MDNITKVCAYCRVSTNKKEQQLSFNNQKKYFESILTKEKGYELIKIYADEGLSGTKFRKRESFNQMLYDAGLNMVTNSLNINEDRNKYISTDYVLSDRKPLFNLIFVKDSSRFARNTEVNRILNRLKDKGVYVYFEDLGKTTENEADRIIIDFLFGMAYQESVDKSNKVKFGMKRNSEQGKIRCGRELYGYTFNKEENTLRIIPKEAEVIKLIFELRLEGNGTRKIAKYLNDNGYKTRNGNEYGISRINTILKNATYMGKQVYNKTEIQNLGDGSSKKRNNIKDWIIKDTDKIDQIIDEKTFYKVQKMMEKTKDTFNNKGVYNGAGDLSDILYCGKCGAKYYRYTSRNTLYYRCKNKVNISDNKKCDNKNIKYEVIQKELEEYCLTYKADVARWFNNIKIVISNKIKHIKEDTEDEAVLAIKKEIAEKEKILEELIDNMLDNSSASMKKVYAKKQAIIDEQLKELEAKLKEHTATDQEKEAKINEILQYQSQLDYHFKNIANNLDIDTFKKTCIEKILVYENKIEINTIAFMISNAICEILGITFKDIVLVDASQIKGLEIL